jgi:pSer/pThr/pTyr-binding forkhead associated (FHA) protein
MLAGLWQRHRLRGFLQIEGGPDDGKELALRELPLTIGRGEEVDLTIGDRWISRRHCEIYEQDGGLALRDLGSRHGTLLNGKAVLHAILKPGDKISLGLTTLVARYTPQS